MLLTAVQKSALGDYSHRTSNALHGTLSAHQDVEAFGMHAGATEVEMPSQPVPQSRVKLCLAMGRIVRVDVITSTNRTMISFVPR